MSESSELKDNILVCDGLVKIYKTEDVEVLALQGLELEILEKPTTGRIYVDGHDLFAMSEASLVEYRKKTVGFVWQNSRQNLFPYLTALQNVEAPMYFMGGNRKERHEKALRLLKLTGIDHKADSYPAQMSGGEQQRVAIAKDTSCG